MKSIILLTYSDLSSKSGNYTLISRRAMNIYNEFQIKTFCICINKNKQPSTVSSDSIDYVLINRVNDVFAIINRIEPNKIIFYGARSYLLIKRLRKYLGYIPECKFSLDIQGAIEERIEYSNILNIKSRIFYLLEKKLLIKSLNNVDEVFVVTEQLISYIQHLNRTNSPKLLNYILIRCGIGKILTTEEKLFYRNHIRNILNVNDKTIVINFSGHMMKWQKIDQVINYFIKLNEKNDNFFFAFFSKPNEKINKKINKSFPNKNYIVTYLDEEDYFKYLCACDIGVILRDYNLTNLVAFPNKFSDYLNSGLIIALNNAIKEPYDILKKHSLPFIDLEYDNYEKIIELYNYRSKSLTKYYELSEYICYNEISYTKQIQKNRHYFE